MANLLSALAKEAKGAGSFGGADGEDGAPALSEAKSEDAAAVDDAGTAILRAGAGPYLVAAFARHKNSEGREADTIADALDALGFTSNGTSLLLASIEARDEDGALKCLPRELRCRRAMVFAAPPPPLVASTAGGLCAAPRPPLSLLLLQACKRCLPSLAMAVLTEAHSGGWEIDLEVRDEECYTPLLWTLEHGLEEVAEALIAAGADCVRASNSYGISALDLAILSSSESIALGMIARGATLSSGDGDPWKELQLVKGALSTMPSVAAALDRTTPIQSY